MSAEPQAASVLAALQSLAHDPGKILHVSTLEPRRRALFVSSGVESLLGHPTARWLAEPELFWRSLHPDDAARVEAAFAAWDLRSPIELRYRLRARDGRVVHCVETTGATLDGPGGPQQQGLIADETEVQLLLGALDAVHLAADPRRAIRAFCDALASLLGLAVAGFADARGRAGPVVQYGHDGRANHAEWLADAGPRALIARACAGPGPVEDDAGGYRIAACVPGPDGVPRGTLWGERPTPLSLGPRERRTLTGLARHAALALQRADLLAELGRLGAERQRLAESVVMAHEDERRRIANELHDGAGQTLMAAIIQLDLARARLDTPAARDALDRARTQVERTLEDLRGLAHALRPATLDRLGLADALREMAGSFSGAALAVEAHVPDGAVRLEPEVATTVFRIAQSSLTNVARHARARRAVLRLELGEGRVELVVEDDGRGLQRGPSVGGIGLLAMRERAQAVGGTLDVEGRAEGGTRVRVTIPIRTA